MDISLLSNKYSNHVHQIFPSIQLFILESAIKLKEKKKVKQQQRKESYWLLFKKTHILQRGKKNLINIFF